MSNVEAVSNYQFDAASPFVVAGTFRQKRYGRVFLSGPITSFLLLSPAIFKLSCILCVLVHRNIGKQAPEAFKNPVAPNLFRPKARRFLASVLWHTCLLFRIVPCPLMPEPNTGSPMVGQMNGSLMRISGVWPVENHFIHRGKRTNYQCYVHRCGNGVAGE